MTFGVLAAAAASSSSTSNAAPGALGFLVIAAMGVALVFLLRSMNKQFRKITPAAEAETAGSQGAEVADRVDGTRPGQAETPKQDTPA